MTKYFWTASLTWQIPGGGTGGWDRSSTFTTDAPVSRAATLSQLLDAARSDGAPETGISVAFFSIEPDEVTR